MTAHRGLVDITSYMGYLRRAFPSSADKNYFEQCPKEFDQVKLVSFSRWSHSSKANFLFQKAKDYQPTSVKSWYPNIGKTSSTVYIGLVGLDEAASKECPGFSWARSWIELGLK